MTNKLLRDLNNINKFCKRFFDSYIIYNDIIVGGKDGKVCDNIVCRLNALLDISVENVGNGIYIDSTVIAQLFKTYKSRELDIIAMDENKNISVILPDNTKIPFVSIKPIKSNVMKFISDKIVEINDLYETNISYRLDELEIERLIDNKQLLIIKENFKLFICKKLFPTIKRNGSDEFKFYFKDIDNEQFKAMTIISDKDMIMDIISLYHCVHF